MFSGFENLLPLQFRYPVTSLNWTAGCDRSKVCLACLKYSLVCRGSSIALGNSFIYIRSSTAMVPTEPLELLLLAKTKWNANLTQVEIWNKKASREACIQYICPIFSNWRNNPSTCILLLTFKVMTEPLAKSDHIISLTENI